MSLNEQEAAAVRPEPFVSFPLWGLRKALADHERRCDFCNPNIASGRLCLDPWYRSLLDNKIALAVSR